jgi:protein-S-isoprenylcysteine O-methyltransferase Ste14
MSGIFRAKRHFLYVAVALLAIAAPVPAFSQGCSLCYTQAASAGARMIEALRSGILILIVPPTLVSVAMIFVVLRKRNQFRRDDTPDVSGHW